MMARIPLSTLLDTTLVTRMPFSPEEQTSLAAQVLNLVNSANYQPVKPKVIAKKLGLDKDQAKDLRKLVKKLVKRGQLSFGATHLVRPPGAAESDRVTGVFRRTQGGFGFVRPRGAEYDRDDDIFIAMEDSRDAASGDVVLVKLLKRHGRHGKPEGMILEVIERETHEFVGTYLETAGQGFVRVDGGMFNQPIAVGDPGAKNAHTDDKVVFEMVRFPSHIHDGEGVIVEVLARAAPRVSTRSA